MHGSNHLKLPKKNADDINQHVITISLQFVYYTTYTGRYWEMIERLKVNQFNTTPSAIRCLMKSGSRFVKQHDLSSLKTIGSGNSKYNKPMYMFMENATCEWSSTVLPSFYFLMKLHCKPLIVVKLAIFTLWQPSWSVSGICMAIISM